MPVDQPVSKPLLVSIVGPTAVGKTALAIELALTFETEIVSADSRQFYRELTLGTAKPGTHELSQVPHHFIDSHSIHDEFSAGAYGRAAAETIRSLHEEHAVVLAVGGSSLYLKALWEGFDEMPPIPPGIREALNKELAQKGLAHLLDELKAYDPDYFEEVDQKNGQRIVRALEVVRGTGKPFSTFRKERIVDLPYRNLKIGIQMEREVLFDRINRRMNLMIKDGLFAEVASLVDYQHINALQTVGYSEIFGYLKGDYDREEAIRLLKRNSRRYAKRQITWFRRYEDIHWFDPGQKTEIIKLIRSNLSVK